MNIKTFLNKNKAPLLLPLALLPFVVLIFYILGGGENAAGGSGEAAAKSNPDGVNYLLPEAESSIEIFDKMEAYQKREVVATQDYNILGDKDSTGKARPFGVADTDSTRTLPVLFDGQNSDEPTHLLEHIKQKEENIQKELALQDENPRIERQQNPKAAHQKKEKEKPSRQTGEPTSLMQEEKQEQAASNFSFTGIEELDKIFDENLELNRQNDSLKFFLAQSKNQLLEIGKAQSTSFTLDKKQASAFNKEEGRLNAPIKAEIYETETVLDGNRVKLRLLEDAQINGQEIPKNSFVYGICKTGNERLHIEISQLPVGDSFLPVKLTIHDLDGLPGLYVPDNAVRKVTKEVGASTNTSSLFGVTNDPLAYAGIRAVDRTAQTLLKGVRLKRVTVKKNTLVYLFNEQ